MDKETLIKNRERAKKLTANDIKRLAKLKETIEEGLRPYAMTKGSWTEVVKDENVQTGNAQVENVQAENVQAKNVRTRDLQTDNVQMYDEYAEYLRILEVMDYMLAEGIKLEQEGIS